MINLILFSFFGFFYNSDRAFTVELFHQKSLHTFGLSNQDFKELGGGYSKDSFNVYFQGKVVPDASSSSFKYLGGGYAKDAWNVFYRGALLRGASASSFKYVKNEYGKDSWKIFYHRQESWDNTPRSVTEIGGGN